MYRYTHVENLIDFYFIYKNINYIIELKNDKLHISMPKKNGTISDPLLIVDDFKIDKIKSKNLEKINNILKNIIFI